jgi:hypothetical protein
MKAIAAVILVVLLLVFSGFVHDARLAGDFPSIRAKSSEADVRRIMGEPKQIQRPCQAYGTSVQPGCDHVFLYRSIFYPLKNRYWLVFFDQNNQVTATSSQLEP